MSKNITSGQYRVLLSQLVGGHQLVHIFHPSLCGIIIHDNLWFLMHLATDSLIPVQCTQSTEYHICAFLWHIGYQGCVRRVHNLTELGKRSSANPKVNGSIARSFSLHANVYLAKTLCQRCLYHI